MTHFSNSVSLYYFHNMNCYRVITFEDRCSISFAIFTSAIINKTIEKWLQEGARDWTGSRSGWTDNGWSWWRWKWHWSPDGICLLMKMKLTIVIKLLLRAQILMKPKDLVHLVTQNMNMAITQCWKIVQIKLFM